MRHQYNYELPFRCSVERGWTGRMMLVGTDKREESGNMEMEEMVDSPSFSSRGFFGIRSQLNSRCRIVDDDLIDPFIRLLLSRS